MKTLITTLIIILISCIPHAYAFELMGDKTNLFEKRHYQSHTGLASMDYYLLTPKNYDPKKSYPLVLTLHGVTSRGYAAYILSEDAMRNAYPAFVLVPIRKGLNWSLPAYTDLSPEPMAHAIKIIERLEKEFSIDPHRIYVTGSSVGGFGTYEIVAKYPDFFAAAVPLCGGGQTSDAVKMAKTPMWIFHGQADNGIPVQKSREMVATLRQAGTAPIYSEYPGVGHNVWEYAYRDPRFWQWLFSQKKP